MHACVLVLVRGIRHVFLAPALEQKRVARSLLLPVVAVTVPVEPYISLHIISTQAVWSAFWSKRRLVSSRSACKVNCYLVEDRFTS